MGISMYNKTTLDLDIAFNNDLLEPDGIVQVTDVLVGSSTVWRIRFEYSTRFCVCVHPAQRVVGFCRARDQRIQVRIRALSTLSLSKRDDVLMQQQRARSMSTDTPCH